MKTHQGPKRISVRWLLAGVTVVVAAWLSVDAFAEVSIVREFGSTDANTGLGPRSGLVADAAGVLYGTLSMPDAHVRSAVFSIRPDGSGFRLIKAVTSIVDGYAPDGALVLNEGVLFGVMAEGGSPDPAAGYGTVFRINVDGTGFQVLKRFSGVVDGQRPRGLALAGGTLVGLTREGGTFGAGTVFRLHPDGSDFAVLRHLNPEGGDSANPSAPPLVVDNTIYGTTSANTGAIFRMQTDGSGFAVIHTFDSWGGRLPLGGLIHSAGVLYGTTSFGGTNSGAVFRVAVDGTGYWELKSYALNLLAGADGLPQTGLVLSGDLLYGTTSRGGTYFSGTVFRVRTDGTGYERVTSIAPIHGVNPVGGLLLLGDNIYSTAFNGGTADRGTVFRASTNGGPAVKLRDFVYGDGAAPTVTTVFGDSVYGITFKGGNYGWGTIFRVRADGTGYATILHLSPETGWGIDGDIVVLNDMIYAVIRGGGGPLEYGTFFRVRVDGTEFQALRYFGVATAKGRPSGLTAANGVVYGTTDGSVFRYKPDEGIAGFAELPVESWLGGIRCRPAVTGNTIYVAGDSGVIRINTDGSGYGVLMRFTTDPPNPREAGQSLLLAGDVLFGASYAGGELGLGTLYRMGTDGSGYKIIKSFTEAEVGRPAALVHYRGKLYGTVGRTNLFAIATNGTDYTVIHRMNGEFAGLAGFFSGRLFGHDAGGHDAGRVFSLGPFSRPPVANDARYYRLGASLDIPLADLISFYTSDPDGDARTLVRIGSSAQGAAISVDSQFIHYTAISDAPDEFQYSVSDGFPEWGTAWIRVEFVPAGGRVQSMRNPAGGVSIRCVGVPGATYGVQHSTNLVDWTLRTTFTAPATSQIEYQDGSPISPSFYRLIRQ
jgi:hypothetical protein